MEYSQRIYKSEQPEGFPAWSTIFTWVITIIIAYICSIANYYDKSHKEEVTIHGYPWNRFLPLIVTTCVITRTADEERGLTAEQGDKAETTDGRVFTMMTKPVYMQANEPIIVSYVDKIIPRSCTDDSLLIY